MYYLTFGELVDLLQRRDFGAVVDLPGITAQLRDVITLRNAVAHSRPPVSQSVARIEMLVERLTQRFGDELCQRLIEQPEVGVFPGDGARMLLATLRQSDHDIRAVAVLTADLRPAAACRAQFWWGESELAGFDTSAVDEILYLLQRTLD